MEVDLLNERLKEIERVYKAHDFPPNVLVESTASCNIRCIQCANDKLKRKKGNMEISLYKKIVDEASVEDPDIKFWLAFYGEPLLLKYRLYYMIRYAKDKGLKNVYINTNATLMNDEMSDMLLDSGVDHVIVGIDGYSSDTFEKIRVRAKRDTVYENVLRLRDKMRKRNVSKPRIEAQFIVMDENKHELDDYLKFWAEQGIAVKVRDRVTWSSHVEAEGNISDSLDRIACGWAIGTCPIAWDGSVVACGTDCDAEYVFGNVGEQSIKEIWNGKRKQFVSDHLEHHFEKLPRICHTCPDWQVIGTTDYDENGNVYKKIHR